MLQEIENKIEKAREALRSIGYLAEEVSGREFYDYLTGETFSGDTITLEDVLGNEYLLVHELAEITELKKKALAINKRVIVDSPRNMIYDAHLTAMEAELEYAFRKKDYFWIRVRLRQYKESTLDADPHLPKEMKARAERLFERFCNVIEES
ncbi:MAG: hypothetical protein FGF48_03165 [Candidatus Brockarchaeota archaeon]|nr:hypothetical protein [Candidatus Brockarchaeota archaeon]